MAASIKAKLALSQGIRDVLNDVMSQAEREHPDDAPARLAAFVGVVGATFYQLAKEGVEGQPFIEAVIQWAHERGYRLVREQ